ncbi:MAG: polyketide synthase dehydratase domain-containing protein [Spirochaetes bacterium]|nr:polyketide synthase dehydratase domain-containing protein [Spirochaetota bacterium]
MEEFSKVIDTVSLPFEIHIPEYIFDHHQGKLTFVPAVEICQVLSSVIQKQIPDINALHLYNASFNKLIELEPGQTSVYVLNQLEIHKDGSVISKLLTKKKLQKTGITRSVEYVNLEFRKDFLAWKNLTYDTASALDGICFRVPVEKIYKELIFFGPAFQNISNTVYLTPSGATGRIFARALDNADGPLGSPFVFDAALHVANIWGQRYHNTIAFPVSFKRRIIHKPAVPGEEYFVRVIPCEDGSGNLVFEIYIYDLNGNPCESASGIIMRDINKSSQNPPDWIIRKNCDSLTNISQKCRNYSVIEIESVPDFAVKALSPEEFTRQESMTDKRRKSFISARLACKQLTRKLDQNCVSIPADEIITMSDNKYPKCPVSDGSIPFNCSVSHDNRFAVAAVSLKRIGIDVEAVSERLLKTAHFYISAEEEKTVASSKLDRVSSCLRAWSVKEAVTKALDIKLAESWKLVKVTGIEKSKSTFILNGAEITAYHDVVDNHLFTVVEL